MNLLKRIFGLASVAAALAGCAASTPAPVLLTLPPATSATSALAPAPSASMPLLAVRRVGIPEYLAARRVRYRADPSTLAEWPNTYWAERIEIGVSREFIAALRQQLPGWALCEATCGEQTPMLALQVDLAPLDYLRSDRQLQARARIGITSGAPGPRPLPARELSFLLPVANDSAQGHAEAISALLRQLAMSIAPLIQAAPR
jgi:uncharacterized lipoprotein YmbA